MGGKVYGGSFLEAGKDLLDHFDVFFFFLDETFKGGHRGPPSHPLKRALEEVSPRELLLKGVLEDPDQSFIAGHGSSPFFAWIAFLPTDSSMKRKIFFAFAISSTHKIWPQSRKKWWFIGGRDLVAYVP